MPTINKTSIRDEINRLKTEFDKINEQDKISKECLLLMRSMFVVIDLILSIFLEKKTKKSNHNSSKPSSQTEKDESALKQKGSNGKGKEEKNQIINNTRTIENITVSEVNICDSCGENLTDVPSHSCQRRTKIDIVFEKVINHIDAQIKNCPNCHAIVCGSFPSDMPGPRQYGAGLKAYIVNLLICQMISLNRVQKLVKTLIGTLISEASILKFVWRVHCALEAWELSAMQQLHKQLVLNVDETSLRVNKKNHWIHVYSSGDITLKFLHHKRGKEAIEAIGIIPKYGGSIIHDCWASYLSYDHCKHGLCGSHLLRELTFVIESNHYAWAKNMKRLLQETCRKVSKNKQKKLTEKKYINLQKRYRNIITRGERELPAIPAKPNGRRGKMAKSDAHNLWERLKEHEAAVLLFARDSHVSFTNNRAERDLRMAKVKQKVSGCFRTQKYAEAYCRISSYLQTMANKGINPLIAIQMALAGQIDVEG